MLYRVGGLDADTIWQPSATLPITTWSGMMLTRRCKWWLPKRKLLVVAGAGSTLEFGMPSSNCIHDIFLRSAAEHFPLNSAPQRNLYVHLHDQLGRYWCAQGSPLKPNFEDVLFAITQLSAMPPEPGYEKFTPALGAFVKVCDFPRCWLWSSRYHSR
jgi:hypothetical protein